MIIVPRAVRPPGTAIAVSWCMRFGVCLVLAIVATGCVSTVTTPWEYRVPLAGNSIGPDAAADCAVSCRMDHAGHEDDAFECIERCPGVNVTENAECSDSSADRPPIALCYTRLVQQSEFDPSVALGVIELLSDVASAVPAPSGHHFEHHSSSAHAEPHSRRRVQ